jgi:hypothetical protein
MSDERDVVNEYAPGALSPEPAPDEPEQWNGPTQEQWESVVDTSQQMREALEAAQAAPEEYDDELYPRASRAHRPHVEEGLVKATIHYIDGREPTVLDAAYWVVKLQTSSLSPGGSPAPPAGGEFAASDVERIEFSGHPAPPAKDTTLPTELREFVVGSYSTPSPASASRTKPSCASSASGRRAERWQLCSPAARAALTKARPDRNGLRRRLPGERLPGRAQGPRPDVHADHVECSVRTAQGLVAQWDNVNSKVKLFVSGTLDAVLNEAGTNDVSTAVIVRIVATGTPAL